jgi:hypothetical protein
MGLADAQGVRVLLDQGDLVRVDPASDITASMRTTWVASSASSDMARASASGGHGARPGGTPSGRPGTIAATASMVGLSASLTVEAPRIRAMLRMEPKIVRAWASVTRMIMIASLEGYRPLPDPTPGSCPATGSTRRPAPG